MSISIASEDKAALRSFLVRKLTPQVDADPLAVAKFLLACLRADSDRAKVRARCVKEMTEFLGERKSFFFFFFFFAFGKRKAYGRTGFAFGRNLTAPRHRLE